MTYTIKGLPHETQIHVICFIGQPLFTYLIKIIYILQSIIYLCQNFQKKVLFKAAGINTHLVVAQVIPFFIGEKFIIGLSGFVHFFLPGPAFP